MKAGGQRRRKYAPGREAGMTLVELMVAMAIGLFLIGGALYVYSQSRDSYRSGDSLARLQESARFALDTLEPDIRLAGYWGQHAEPAAVELAAGIPITCSGGNNATAWAVVALKAGARADDDNYDLPCPAFLGLPRDDSDVLVLSHASPDPVAPDAGQIQAISWTKGSDLVNDGSAPGAGMTLSDVIVNAYYVSDRSSFDAGMPSLRHLTLVKNGILRDEEIIPGVENLQVQFGIDADGDGNVERYVDPDNPAVAGGDAVAAVRLWLLVATPADEVGFVDTASYQPLDGDLDPIEPGSETYPENFRRVAVTKTIFLRNQAL